MSTQNESSKVLLFVIAFMLSGIEKFVPVIPILPWLKVGLFHAVVMVWIYRFGLLDALAFILIRQWVILSFFGFSFLPFILGTSATLVSVLLGAVLIKSGKFGMIIIGIFCAVVHNITQLSVLYLIMGGNFVWQWQLSIMTAVSLFTGAITGILAYKINKISFDFNSKKTFENTKIESGYNILGIILLLFIITTTVIFENYIFYAILCLLILVISRPSLIKFIKRYGIFLFALYFSSTFISVVKITIWFLLTPFFQRFGFYRLFYGLLLKIFPQKFSQTLSIGAVMPQIFPNILEETPVLVKSVFKNPKNIMNILAEKSQKILLNWK